MATRRLFGTATMLFAAASLFATASTARAADSVDAGNGERFVIDGTMDEAFWARAQQFDDFVVVQPNTQGKPTYPTSVRIIGLPGGIAIGYRVTQPRDAPHLRAQTARDDNSPGDRVNAYIDFNADGVVAHNVTIALSGSLQDGTISSETQYSTDWDGDWGYAVREEPDVWWVELLVPWTTASMRDAEGPTRTIAVQFDRVYAATSERSAFPGATTERQRFVSDFRHITIDQYRASSFHWFPYVSSRADLVDDRIENKAGVDLFWKPSGDFQLAATLNPDFGQVEADELVVNFDAIETFFSDKRPFFAENKGFFDLRTPNDGLLIYTRRIGGPSDVDGDAADIDAAVKVNGSYAGFDYGVLGALESDYADDEGRAFYAQRATRRFGDLTLGYLGTYVDRPAIDRDATVNALDFNWRASRALQLQGQVILTDVDQFDDGYRDSGEWVRLLLTPQGRWQHEVELTHFGAQLDYNDLGYQPRASLNQLDWTTTYTINDYAATSPWRSTIWAAEPIVRANDEGDRLPAVLLLSHDSNLRSGTHVRVEQRYQFAGTDDLITRGHGDVKLAPRPWWYGYVETPRRGDWSFRAGAWYLHEGLDDGAWQLEFAAKYFVNDALTVDGFVEPLWSDDWLIWDHDDVLGRYTREQVAAGFNLNWLPARGHELRAKLQWLAIDAEDARAYRVGDDGVPRPIDAPIDPFTIANIGLQLRYRWTFRPQSDLYVVYSRGGFRDEPLGEDGIGDVFLDTLDLRDADQFLVKLRYRF